MILQRSENRCDAVDAQPAVTLSNTSDWSSLTAILGAIPIPLALVLILIFQAFTEPRPYDPPYLLPILNLGFITMAFGLTSYLATLSVIRNGSMVITLLGCGTLTSGIATFFGGMALQSGAVNEAITVHNIGMGLAAFFHVLSAITAYWPSPRLHNARLKINLYYALVIALSAILIIVASRDMLPVFFVPGKGPTGIRQFVLGSSIFMYATASLLICGLAWRRRWAFGWWYGLSLGMLATGLFGVLTIQVLGSPQSWVGRIAQYLSGVYMLVAVFRATRFAGDWDATLQLALQESRERFRVLAEATFEGVLVSEDDVIIDANRQLHEMLGCRPPELLGRRLSDLAPPDELSGDELAVTIAGQEYPLLCKDGSRIFVEAHGRSMQSAGKLRRFIAIRDVTQRRQQAAALAEMNQMLSQTLERMQESRDDLERRVAERTAELEVRARQLSRLTSELTLAEQRERRRLATLLHDHLQQLLVGARLGLDVLRRRSLHEQQPVVQQVEQLISEAIEASRSLTVELSPPILHEAGLAAGLHWLARWMRDKHNLHVSLATDERANSDREDVRVLVFESVRELLFNVVKHAKVNEAQVVLALHGLQHFRAEVTDQGRGFDPAVLESPPDDSSGGYGLFSIRERLAMLGGRLEIHSAPGQGARFSLIAPLGGRTAPLDDLQTSLPQASLADTAADVPAVPRRGPGNTIRLMLVDDHEVLRQGLAALLAEEPSIEVVAQASNGFDALALARQHHPDVVLMDFSMPGMDGLEATRRLNAELPHIRVIGLSMYEESDRAAAMIAAGAVAYLTKSGRSEILIETIKAAPAMKPALATAAG